RSVSLVSASASLFVSSPTRVAFASRFVRLSWTSWSLGLGGGGGTATAGVASVTTSRITRAATRVMTHHSRHSGTSGNIATVHHKILFGQPGRADLTRSRDLDQDSRVRNWVPQAITATGLVLVVVGTFLPWSRSGMTYRNSYASLGVLR